jgi:hypothetical protein
MSDEQINWEIIRLALPHPGIKSRTTKRKSTKGIKRVLVQIRFSIAPSVGFGLIAQLLMPGKATLIYQFQF